MADRLLRRLYDPTAGRQAQFNSPLGRGCPLEVRLKTIARNAIAVWGRNVIAVVLGLFSARWVLASLGSDGLGLYGALAGLAAFAGVVGSVLQLSMVRSMSITLGKGEATRFCGICKASSMLGLAFAVLVLVVALPLGELYVAKLVSMPDGCNNAACWLWRFVAIGTALSGIALCAHARLMAEQRFGVLSAIGVAQTIGYFAIACVLVFCMGSVSLSTKLIVFGAGNLALGLFVTVATIFAADAVIQRAGPDKRGFAVAGMVEMLRYAACEFWSSLGDIVRRNGVTLYLNNAFGASANAAWGIGNTVNNHASSLSSAVVGAFMPAALQEDNGLLELESARWGFVTIAVFAIPFWFVKDWLLTVWLENPPLGSAFFAASLLVGSMIQRLGNAQHLAVMKTGKVALYHAIIGTTSMLTLPIAMACCASIGFRGAGVAFCLSFVFLTIERVILGRMIAGVGVTAWARVVLLPCSLFAISLGVVLYFVSCLLGLS